MDRTDLSSMWVYLSASPLFGLTLTLLAYSLAHRLYLKGNGHPLLNPVVTSVALIVSVLLLTQTNYETYFEGGQFIHFLLGPATVALAVPLYQQWARLRRIWAPLMLGLLAGSTAGALSAVILARVFGASLQTQLSLAPKSVTAPVAMGISEHIGGLPSLTAVMVVMTGIIGAVTGTRLMILLRINDDSVKGVAMGVAAHGIGTARAFQISQQMGAFSGLAMALSAFIVALILPPLIMIF
ncbi:LrgB family protein [Aestuariirhabdus sp. Z084]|uniref:LrgB family protein n=1 Tax=Aestuariirhabdus haliotis TaxID=2918751 RepID=UPI00201B3C7A|nr:LrgB family protein [Aestuariirhabdus haliotis]MCL6416618.1 LrgB family protein [Aestuariirhabdus haliotis]MCL6420653.1 LrgB family protein [Aestuariirhabdus haliotis]